MNTPGLNGRACLCVMRPPPGEWGVAGEEEDGAAAFERLSDADKLRILGPGKFAAYRDGAISLDDLVEEGNTPGWGKTRHEASLRDALDRAGSRGGGGGDGKKPPASGEFGEPPQDDPDQPGHWTEADRLRALRPIPQQSAEHRAANRPARTQGDRLIMNPRHKTSTIRPNSRVEPDNTALESWIPEHEELAAMYRGDAVKLAERPMVREYPRSGDLYLINGRRYVVQHSGHTYPYDGPGVHLLDGPEFQLLKDIFTSPDPQVALNQTSFEESLISSQERFDFVLRLAREGKGLV